MAPFPSPPANAASVVAGIISHKKSKLIKGKTEAVPALPPHGCRLLDGGGIPPRHHTPHASSVFGGLLREAVKIMNDAPPLPRSAVPWSFPERIINTQTHIEGRSQGAGESESDGEKDGKTDKNR